MRLNRILKENPTLDAYRVSFLTNRYIGVLARHLHAEHKIVWQEWVVLFCLAQVDGLNAKEICEITSRPKNTVSDAIRRLLQLGLIDRQRDPRDGRAKILSLHPKGRAIYDAMLPKLQECERSIFGVLSEHEHQQLDFLLDKLVQHVRDWPEAAI